MAQYTVYRFCRKQTGRAATKKYTFDFTAPHFGRGKF